MSTKEVQEAIYKNMEAWKKIENASWLYGTDHRKDN